MHYGRKTFLITTIFLVTVALRLYYSLADDPLVVRQIPTSRRLVALTFDDGPESRTTPEILAVLREKKARGTFFVLGKNAETRLEILRQTAADGHEIGSHAYSHIFLNTMAVEAYSLELDKSIGIIRQVTHAPTVFRPPGGGYNDQIVLAAGLRGMTTVLWSIDSGDWRGLSAERIANGVLWRIRPGSIVLFHDGQYPIATAKALHSVIDKLRAADYELVTVSELLQYYEVR